MNRMLFFVFLVAVLAGCSSAVTDLGTPTPSISVPSPSFVTPTAYSSAVQGLQTEILHKWEQSPHAYAGDAVRCDACHQLQNGMATSDIAWWNPENGQYERVENGNTLCLNCHTGYDNAKEVHASLTCLDCHDQHGITASCFSCHEQVKNAVVEVPATPVDGHPNGNLAFCEGSGCHSVATQAAQVPFSVHGTSHANVTCEACHDADGLNVGPMDGNVWVVWLLEDYNGDALHTPFRSHNLQYTVDCNRCHFDNNPWDLFPVSETQ